jgi:hypothetical protein
MRLLDSNIVIAAAVPEAEGLRADLSTEPCVISIVTRIEVLGFHRLNAEEENGLREFLARVETIALDDVVAARSIALRQQRKMGLGDAIIAATALVHCLALVTRNVDDFKHIAGLELKNPFQTTEDA